MANRARAAAWLAPAFLLALPMIALGTGVSAQTAIESGWVPLNLAQATTDQPPPKAPPSGAAPAPPAEVSLNVEVIAKALNEARIGIEPKIGASTYTMSQGAIQNLPGGQNTAIDNAILQMPGVDQDNLANGGLHIRNEHLNVQYRIDGIIIPDGVSYFGQDLSLRFLNSMTLITGALPAEYGLRTAGIIDIQSKSGVFNPGGSVEMYGGSYATLNPSMEAGGTKDGYSWFVTGSYLENNEGINNNTASYNPIHDWTAQTHDFAYIDKILDPNNRVSVMGGVFYGNFEVPNNPSTATFPGFTAINGLPISTFNSAALSDFQIESSQFGAISFLHSQGDLDFQVSALTKYSWLAYHSDQLGDLAFNGIGENAGRSSFATNVEAEGTYRLNPAHTVRGGLLFTDEHVTSQFSAVALPQIGTDSLGNPIFGTTTTTVGAQSEETSYSYSAYLQDEWKAARQIDDQLRRALRSRQRLYQGQPAQPAHQRRVAGDADDDVSRRLCALFHAAAARAGVDRTSRPLCRHQRRTRRHAKFADQERERRLFRCRRAAAPDPGPHRRRRPLLQIRARSARRGAVRRADHPDTVQLQTGHQQGCRIDDRVQRREFHVLREPGNRQPAG